MSKKYRLMKSDPDTSGWDDLGAEKRQTTCWDGVRNYQARNLLRDDIQVGDGVLFYHSSADPTAVVGIAKVVQAGYPDPSQFDRRSKYHDPKSSKDAPRWYAVDIRAEKALARPVTLETMRATPALKKMRLLQRGTRLSVLPVTAAEWRTVTKLGARS